MLRLPSLRLTVFLSAFLLFQIELILAKDLLPGFGGSYLVWATCMLFFQITLLVGYGYAHLAAKKFTVKTTAMIQVVLPFLALALSPAGLDGLEPSGRLPFILDISRLLVISIGGTFLVLSTISVTSQNLLAASDLPEGTDPYFLYGISNLGSFAALVSYPFLFEPLFDLDQQFEIWKITFVFLAVLQVLAVAGLVKHARPETVSQPPAESVQPPSRRDLLYWGLLSAAGAAMFIAVTNVITFDLASVPLLWILPLAIYLLSFYLNFRQHPRYQDLIADRILIAAPLGLFLFMLVLLGYVIKPQITITAHLIVLFIFCMFCQRRLILARPTKTRQLSHFYLAIAGGGAAGTILVTIAAPLLTSSLTEYPVGFILLFSALSVRSEDRGWTSPILAGTAAAVPAIAWPVVQSLGAMTLTRISPAVAGFAFALIFFVLRHKPRALVTALLVITAVTANVDYLSSSSTPVYRHRNFFGVYHIYEQQGKRFLRHGATIHGSQYLSPPLNQVPLMYYHPSTPAGALLQRGIIPLDRVAIVGLGTGALSVYGRPGSTIDFYELDPDNLMLARKYFTYLDQSPARLNFIFGDARLSLARFDTPPYDLIIIDAFNSDSIPVHLITVEALDLYRRRLKPQGLVMFHVSNRFLNLVPVILADARALGLPAIYKTNQDQVHFDAEACEWLIVTPDPELSRTIVNRLQWTDLSVSPRAGQLKPWTDRYSNLFRALRSWNAP